MKTKLTTLLALLLTLALLLAGCGGSADKVSGQVAPLPETQPAETTAPTEPLSAGRIEGGTYTNAYAGFGCTLDSSWVFYGADELQELPAEIADQLEDGSAMAEYLDQAQQFMDMKVENEEMLASVNVLYQKVSLTDRAVFAALGEAELIDMILEQEQENMVSSYAQMGIEVQSMSRADVEFLGEARSALYTVASYQGIPYYLTQFFDYSRGSYSITTTFASFVEDSTLEVAGLFYAVD